MVAFMYPDSRFRLWEANSCLPRHCSSYPSNLFLQYQGSGPRSNYSINTPWHGGARRRYSRICKVWERSFRRVQYILPMVANRILLVTLIRSISFAISTSSNNNNISCCRITFYNNNNLALASLHVSKRSGRQRRKKVKPRTTVDKTPTP